MAPNTLENIILIYAAAMLLLTACVIVAFYRRGASVISGSKSEHRQLGSLIFLLLSAGFLCLILKKHYGVDSFAIYADPAPFHPIAEGRYLKATVSMFFLRTGINQIEMQQVCFTIWLIFTCISCRMISSSVIKALKINDRSKKMILTAITSLIFINTFYMELTLFPEVALENALSNLVFGAGIFVMLSDLKRIVRWPLAFILLFGMTTGYQLYMPMFVVITLMASGIKYIDEVKKRYSEAIFILIAGASSWGLNFLIMKVLENIGVTEPSDSVDGISLDVIVQNAKGVIFAHKDIWDNCLGTYRIHYLMTGVGVLLLSVAFLAFFKLKKAEQHIYFFLVLAGSYALSFAVHFIEQPQEITPRSLLPLWSVFACVLMMGLYRDVRIVYVLTIALLLINIFHMNDMSLNLLKMNERDLYEASVIADKIKTYESETGNTVDSVEFRSDGDVVYHHPDSKYKVYQLGARIMATYFSRSHCVGYFLGRDIPDGYIPDEDFERLAQGRNWDHFVPDEQIITEDNKVYVIIY
ncbi:MAG: glucosyltransferase domain-containing protein [Lachnospiraceae bacterium]|nr:glucosyltransferase domain-containing protein [Lachnospiraceae bacterium]